MPTDVTPTDIFKFVTETFDDETGSQDLQYALTVIMATVDEEDPKMIVKQFGVVMRSYQEYCLSKIASQMSQERNIAVSDLHNASITVQGSN